MSVRPLVFKCLFLLFFLQIILPAEAKDKNDPVIMTVAGKDIHVSEFLYIANKGNSVDFSDPKSVDDYIKLFTNFKLKVADAEAAGLDKANGFTNEYEQYKASLTQSYLSDPKGEEEAVRREYNRSKEVLNLDQICFTLPKQTVSLDTVAVYKKALEAYQRIMDGEDFVAVGEELQEVDPQKVRYEHNFALYPLSQSKAFENVVYAMPEGTISKPFRTMTGFYIVRMNERIPNTHLIHVAHILIGAPADSVEILDKELATKADKVYKRAISGEDFAALAKEFSADEETKDDGGVLPVLGIGQMIRPFEKAAFDLKNPGDIAKPVKTKLGYSIIKLLHTHDLPSFDSMKDGFAKEMKQGEFNFEYYRAFDDRMKKEYKYVPNEQGLNDFFRICDEQFPYENEDFFKEASELKGTICSIDGEDVPQAEFAFYLQRFPFSAKTYAGDFVQEVYDLFIRDILTTREKAELETKYPEYNHLLQEYRDGILLFDISNQKVWGKPLEEQEAAEADWVAQLQKTYPVKIDKKVVKNLKKYNTQIK